MKAEKDFHLEYARFIEQRGVLYERIEAPMTETERKKTKEYYWVILFLFVLFSGIGGATFYFNVAKGVTVGMVFFILLYIFIMGGAYYSLNSTLKRGKKQVIKAIVTSKKTGKSNLIGLSGQEHIRISDVDFSALNLGDIIQVEKVGKSITFLQRIVKVGSILELDSTRDS